MTDSFNSSYIASPSLFRTHAIPRLGHSLDVSLLLSSDRREQKDYASGVILFSAFILLFFLTWALILLILKCFGSSVGCASGRPFATKMASTVKSNTRAGRSRQVFLLCGAFTLGFSFLVFYLGLMPIENAISAIRESNSDAQATVYEMKKITNAIPKAHNELSQADLDVILKFDDYCLEANNLTVGPTLQTMSQSINNSLSNLKIINARVNDDLNEYFIKADDATEEIDYVLNHYYVHDWYSKVYVIILDAFTALFLLGVLMASQTKVSFSTFQRMLTYFILPLFAILVIVSWILACVFAAASMVNADFCTGGEYPGSPEGTIMNILRQKGVDPDSKLHSSLSYYLQGCVSENNPIDSFSGYLPDLQSTVQSLNQLLSIENTDDATQLYEICGNNHTMSLFQNAHFVHKRMNMLMNHAVESSNILSCEKVVPMYENAIHDATCTYSANGLVWLFMSLFVISTCSMIMITLRASWLDVELTDSSSSSSSTSFSRGGDARQDESVAYWSASAPEYPCSSDDTKSVMTFATKSTADTNHSQLTADSNYREVIVPGTATEAIKVIIISPSVNRENV